MGAGILILQSAVGDLDLRVTFVDTKVVAICLIKSQANPVDVDLSLAVNKVARTGG
jgi:hypothetical protein